MKFSKYALNTFMNNRDMSKLLKEFETELLSEFHPIIEEKLKQIVFELNQHGHNLKLYYSEPDDVHYRDDEFCEGKYNCKLRLAVDTIISVGFADILPSEYDSEE